MQFPIQNISKTKWKEEILDYILYDKYIYTDSDEYFNELLKDESFCDCKGNVYKVKRRIMPTEWWRKVFRYLPNIYRLEIDFYRTGEYMEVDKLRRYTIGRLREYPPDSFLSKWIGILKNAKTHEELIDAEIK